MAKLTDTALTILSGAAARVDGRVLPLPTGLKTPKAAVLKVLEHLLTDELLAETPAGRDDEAWSDNETTGRTTLVITPSGLAAIGIESENEPSEPSRKTNARAATARSNARAPSRTTARKVADRKATAKISSGATKQESVLQLLRQKQGASIAQMVDATGWQAHSVRGFLSGTVKTKMKLAVISEKDKSGERRYRLGSAKGGRD